MKKIGILSDTHGYLEAIDRILVMTSKDDICLWLHAGDYGDDARYMATKTKVPVLAVRGNNDRRKPLEPVEQLIPFEDTYIYMVHGDRISPFARTQDILTVARGSSARLAVAGHSHHHESYEQGDCLFVNPGSPVLPKDGSGGTFAVVTYDQGLFTVEFKFMRK